MINFDSKILELMDKIQPLYEQRDLLNKDIQRISKQIEKLYEQREKERMSQPMSPVEEMEYFLFEDGSVSGERYKAREKYWNDKGLWHSGYFPEIEQICLKLMLYKGDKNNLEQTVCILNQVVPLLKEQSGIKRLGIFEHTLSENGSWSVEITESSFDLVLHRWHRKSVEQSFTTLTDLVCYVQKHHYYEDSESSSYEED